MLLRCHQQVRGPASGPLVSGRVLRPRARLCAPNPGGTRAGMRPAPPLVSPGPPSHNRLTIAQAVALGLPGRSFISLLPYPVAALSSPDIPDPAGPPT